MLEGLVGILLGWDILPGVWVSFVQPHWTSAMEWQILGNTEVEKHMLRRDVQWEGYCSHLACLVPDCILCVLNLFTPICMQLL